MDPCVERGGDTAFGNAVRAGRSFPSEFTFELAIIFSSLPDPVFRACLAQLRAPSRVRLVGGARCGARGFWPTQPGLPGRLGLPPAPSQDGAALDGWTWTG